MKRSANVVTLALAMSFALTACTEETFQNVAGALHRVVLLLILSLIVFATPIILALKPHEYFLSKQRSRLSRMAVLSFLSGPASWPLLWWTISSPCRRPVDLAGTPLGKIGLVIAIISPVAAFVLGAVAASRIRRSQGTLEGLGLARVGVVLGFLMLFLHIGMPHLLEEGCAKEWRPFVGYSSTYGYSRAAGDAKFAVTQAIVYASDNGVYPTSIKVLREGEVVYCLCSDKDPWGNDYVLSPVLTQGRTPREGDNVYVFSRGPKGTGVYPQPYTSDTREEGSVGYSSVDGSWTGGYSSLSGWIGYNQ